MAKNTTVDHLHVRGTSAAISTQTGKAGMILVDTDKNTAVVLDGTTAGGFPLAKEAVKLVAGTSNVKINGGSEANLSGNITIKVLPSSVPGSITLVTDPDAEHTGKFLKVAWTDAEGNDRTYLIDVSELLDTYTAGTGIIVNGHEISIDPKTAFGEAALVTGGGIATTAEGKMYVKASDLLEANGGLQADTTTGKLSVKLEDLVETSNFLKIDETSGKLKLEITALVSADADNILKAGTDGGVFMPGDLGTL